MNPKVAKRRVNWEGWWANLRMTVEIEENVPDCIVVSTQEPPQGLKGRGQSKARELSELTIQTDVAPH